MRIAFPSSPVSLNIAFAVSAAFLLCAGESFLLWRALNVFGVHGITISFCGQPPRISPFLQRRISCALPPPRQPQGSTRQTPPPRVLRPGNVRRRQVSYSFFLP